MKRALPILVLLAAGAAVTLVVAYFAEEDWRAHKRGQFVRAATSQLTILRDTLISDLETLDSVSALLLSTGVAERTTFNRFTAQVVPLHPSIQALEWIPFVTSDRRERFEREARREGHPDFEFTERTGEGRMVSAGRRDSYFPV